MERAHIAMLILVLLSAGCSASISQEKAEGEAINFVSEHVKFFSRNGSTTVDIPSYKFDAVSSYKEGNVYVVTMHVVGTLGNETKDNDLVLKVNSKSGKVVEFNGREVAE